MTIARFWLSLALAVCTSLALPALAQDFGDEPDSLDNAVFPLLQDAGTTSLFPMPDCYGFALEEATIDQMQLAMSQGRLTSQQLVLCYLQRIHQTNVYIEYVIIPYAQLFRMQAKRYWKRSHAT
jgi:hypothetical protein